MWKEGCRDLFGEDVNNVYNVNNNNNPFQSVLDATMQHSVAVAVGQ